jgi:predicted unusual protein kinase regulating ubiquinone biosynthesis (AarF/ABC1/UbiB family)
MLCGFLSSLWLYLLWKSVCDGWLPCVQGNILVRLVDPNTVWGRVANVLRIPISPHLVLLDVGMVAQLAPEDQHHMLRFFKAITKQDGDGIGRNILAMSDHQTCPVSNSNLLV